MSGGIAGARSMLDKFLQQKHGYSHTEQRPYLSTLVDNIPDAEKWRKHIIRDIINKISEIQNENLTESDSLSLNEYINKLLREKLHWERRIKQLGGTDYTSMKNTLFDINNVICIDNYYYFGVAKQNKLVQKLIHKKQIELKTHYTYHQLQNIVRSTEYYDNNNSADNELLSIEHELENQLKHDINYIDTSDDTDIYNNTNNRSTQLTQQQIEQMIVQQRKAELLAKYA